MLQKVCVLLGLAVAVAAPSFAFDCYEDCSVSAAGYLAWAYGRVSFCNYLAEGREAIAAEAVLCAARQSHYQQMHDALFANGPLVAAERFADVAKLAGLDVTEFESCLNARKTADEVALDVADARSLGITSTPTIYVNGLMIIGSKPLEHLRSIINSELTRLAHPRSLK
jgi:protein-disulfide isomerase